MKECYSADAINKMFSYAQLHLFAEFLLLGLFVVLIAGFVYRNKSKEDK